MIRGITRIGLVITGVFLVVATAGAEDAAFLQPAQPGSPPVTSASQRFVFRDFGRADGTLLSTWGDELTARLEKKLGMRAPFHQLEIIRCSASQQDPREVASIRMDQGFVEGLLQQWLVVVNPDVIEEEVLLESMTQLLLNRYLLDIASRQGVGKRGMTLPDWFSVGMAQDLKPELRERNLKFVRERSLSASHPSFDAVVGWDVLPEGRSEEKAYCGLMIHWLAGSVPHSVTWSGFLGRLVSGKPVDAEWLARKVLDLRSVADAEKDWQAWLAERSEHQPEPGGVSFEAVAGLKKRLEMQIENDGIPQTVGPRDLIRERKQDWAKTAAHSMETSLRQLAAASVRELSTVADSYAALLAQVAGSAKRGGVFGFRRSGPSTAELEEKLAAADALLIALEKDVAIRSHYLKTVESGQEAAPEETGTESLEEQRRRFLQEIQQRIGK